MADILIKGLVLPKEGHIEAYIWCNGTVTYKKKIDNQWDRNSTTAIELPEHGDLIDRDKLADGIYHDMDELIYAIDRASVIVEANNGIDN